MDSKQARDEIPEIIPAYYDKAGAERIIAEAVANGAVVE